MKLFITRHGQTDWNLRGIIQGTTDITLNDTGRAQALTVAKELKEERLDAIIVSPLKRAVETAEIINQWKDATEIMREHPLPILISAAFGIKKKRRIFPLVKKPLISFCVYIRLLRNVV